MRPLLVSLLAGLTTFFAYYFLLGGISDRTHPEVPVIEQQGDDYHPVKDNNNNINNGGEGNNSLQPKGHAAATPTPPAADPDADKIEKLRIKLQPKQLQKGDNGFLVKHQFLHLHHMKTAGTCK